MSDRITVARAEDWTAIYVDGELRHQGYIIEDHVYLDLFDELTDIEVDEVFVDQDWLDVTGKLPYRLENVMTS